MKTLACLLFAAALIIACTLQLDICNGKTPCVACEATDAGPTCAVVVNGNIPITLPPSPEGGGL